MARRYVRDSEGRFARKGGGGGKNASFKKGIDRVTGHRERPYVNPRAGWNPPTKGGVWIGGAPRRGRRA